MKRTGDQKNREEILVAKNLPENDSVIRDGVHKFFKCKAVDLKFSENFKIWGKFPTYGRKCLELIAHTPSLPFSP